MQREGGYVVSLSLFFIMQELSFHDLTHDEARKVLKGLEGTEHLVDLTIKVRGVRTGGNPYKAIVDLDDGQYLKPKEAARIIGVRPCNLWKYVIRGQLPCRVMESGHRLYRVEDVEAFARSRKKEEGEKVVVVR